MLSLTLKVLLIVRLSFLLQLLLVMLQIPFVSCFRLYNVLFLLLLILLWTRCAVKVGYMVKFVKLNLIKFISCLCQSCVNLVSIFCQSCGTILEFESDEIY